MLKLIGIAPHPPIIIPAIGRGELEKVRKTVDALELLSTMMKEAEPDLLILITPHGRVMRDGPAILTAPLLHGNFGRFGFPQLQVEFKTDLELVELLRQETGDDTLKPVFLADSESGSYPETELDHGAMVPLYYLQQAGLNVPGLHITYGFNSYPALYKFGESLRRAAEKRSRPFAVLASGDLSHRLIPGAPAGFSRRGSEFDKLLVERLSERQVEEILNFDQQLVEEAGECGLRSFVTALGMFSGKDFSSDILSYEGPFGVGYLVAALKPLDGKNENNLPSSEVASDKEKQPETVLSPAYLARKALEHYLEQGRPLKLPDSLPPEYLQKAGSFVSLKKDGMLRGCIGTIEPVQPSLAREITANAISAALRDPRFPPVDREELDKLVISVDVLSPLERIESKAELDPENYGVMVCSGLKKGLLLPDLEGVDTVDEQVAIAARKAGISSGEKMELYRFTVTRYKED
jgi:MEMO1 family protein